MQLIKKLICLHLFLAITFSSKAGGKMLSYHLAKTYTAAEMGAFWKLHKVPKMIIAAKADVEVYEIVYESGYVDGSLAITSGLYFLPKGDRSNLPLLSYNHGTEVWQDRKISMRGEKSLCLGFATDGYAVAYPDYFGLGISNKDQVYLNAKSEAQNTVDLLKAVDQLNVELNVKLNGQLFLTGYSQGGHAAMATHRLLEKEFKTQFPVTASSPMSGPYDLFYTVDEGKYNEYEYPAFLLMLVKSYYDTKLPEANFSEALKAPFDTIIPSLMNGCNSMAEINHHLPAIPYESLTDEFVKDYMHNPESGFKKYLQENNVYNWSPEAPMQLCYCNADEEVKYQNAITAYETMTKNGSTSVKLKRAGRKFKHENCALFASVYTKMFFDSFVKGGNPKGPVFKRAMLNIGKLAVKP